MRTGNNVMELVGHTPMVRMHRIVGKGDGELWAKLETMNPGGSVKDRAALGIVLDAERRGELKPGGTICEATAGNTGVGLALIGVQRGYRVHLFVPEGFAEEKCILMRGLGAEVVRTPEDELMAGAIRRTLEFQRETPGAFAALQFENPANPDFHEQTTAVEDLRADGRAHRRGGAGGGFGGDVYRDCAVSQEAAAGCADRCGRDRGQRIAGRQTGGTTRWRGSAFRWCRRPSTAACATASFV